MHTLKQLESSATQQREPQAAAHIPLRAVAPPTLYELLQVSHAATPPVIEAAYQALQGQATSNRLELFRAYQILRNPTRRAAYDLELQEGAAEPAAPELPEAGTPEDETKTTTCWRCSAAVAAVARYCSTCHWLICDSCRACGCQNPDWRRTRPVRLVRWPLSAVMALLALTLAVVTTLALASGACAEPLAALRAVGTAPSLVPAAVPQSPILPASAPPAPPPPAPAAERSPRSLGQFVQETFAAVVAGFERSSKR